MLGHPREVQEVRNAFAAYDQMERWIPPSRADLLEAHKLLMEGLVDHAGTFRRGGVRLEYASRVGSPSWLPRHAGILPAVQAPAAHFPHPVGRVGVFRGTQVVHVAPPAKRVPGLVDDLLHWLETVDEHPLVGSCLFHYEFEFIHPFPDGNGRLGRLWQTLILSKWKPVIRDCQEEYYRVLAHSDKKGDATPFVLFMLESLHASIMDTITTDQGTDQVTDQVAHLLKLLKKGEAGASALIAGLGLSHRPTFRKNELEPALAAGLIERTQPDSPNSPTQRYRISDLGRAVLENWSRKG